MKPWHRRVMVPFMRFPGVPEVNLIIYGMTLADLRDPEVVSVIERRHGGQLMLPRAIQLEATWRTK